MDDNKEIHTAAFESLGLNITKLKLSDKYAALTMNDWISVEPNGIFQILFDGTDEDLLYQINSIIDDFDDYNPLIENSMDAYESLKTLRTAMSKDKM